MKRLVLSAESAVPLKRSTEDPLLRYEYDGRGYMTAIQPVDESKETQDAWGRGVCMDYDAKG